MTQIVELFTKLMLQTESPSHILKLESISTVSKQLLLCTKSMHSWSNTMALFEAAAFLEHVENLHKFTGENDETWGPFY